MIDATCPTPTATTQCDPYVFDTSHFERLLSENSARLFVPDEELCIKIVEVGRGDHLITSLGDLQKYLQTTTFKGVQLILIPQCYSWDRLTVSEQGLRLLLTRLNVFPAFVDVLCAFGKSTSAAYDSLGGCYSWHQGKVKEFCALLKDVERHDRPDSEEGWYCDEPWSIRQFGIYHRHDPDKESDTFILLNPTRSFQQRLKDAQRETAQIPNYLDIHTLALSHATWQWRWYLTFWEAQLDGLISRAHGSHVKDTPQNPKRPVLTIDYGHFQDVQVIHDRMNMAHYILSANARVCKKFQTCFALAFKTNVLLDELDLQGLRANNLLERTRSGSSLMQDIISFRSLDALKNSSENSNEMARLADIDSKNMVELTTKSQRDAGKLTKITILTMVYLPASFVAQFLSMGYLRVNSTKHPASLNFASEMWIFFILTSLLFVLTFGMWLYWDSGGQRRRLPQLQWPQWQRIRRSNMVDDKV